MLRNLSLRVLRLTYNTNKQITGYKYLASWRNDFRSVQCNRTSHSTSGYRFQSARRCDQQLYPSSTACRNALTCPEFRRQYEHLSSGQKSPDSVIIRGRIQSIRAAGAKLYFIDIKQLDSCLQLLFDFGSFVEPIDAQKFRRSLGNLQRGDIIEVEGNPERTASNKNVRVGELSVRATKPPLLLAPCLHPMPHKLDDNETKIKARHVDLQLNAKLRGIILCRSAIIQFLREYLMTAGHVEVQTPILAGKSGGASARSFETTATELADRPVHLRIAPELWLKRLVVGGFDRIFEIGQSFRNEGIDSTHNPEFTTCEFYRTYTDIDTLLKISEDILACLAQQLRKIKEHHQFDIDTPSINFEGPYKRLDFIPEIQIAAQCTLPDLQDKDACSKVAEILADREIPFQNDATLPQLLDLLASVYLEPLCEEPTWIINHPECLSPLSKSHQHPDTRQVVALRGELFINCRELINTYEEENSPFEQRRKFEEQIQYQKKEGDSCVDSSFIAALEWGMPPTGGWGCGIDRLTMLMTGSSRISDVLTFGNLRNVVNLERSS